MIFWYVAIKLGEWIIWTGIALYFFSRYFRTKGVSWINLALAAAFLFFGLADFVEYFTQGTFPWWLWAWKIGGGLLLYALLLTADYQKRGRVALSPWRFVAAAFILTLAILCIVWGR